MFYEKYERLCAERGQSVTGVARRLRISPNAPAAWASGAEPRNSTVKRIADYFGVDVSYFDDTDEPESKDDSLILGFMEEMRAKNNLTDDERLLLDMFRTLPEEKKSELLRAAMRMKMDSETH
jgi:transcriptional regulator with XRE-family HTH domain